MLAAQLTWGWSLGRRALPSISIGFADLRSLANIANFFRYTWHGQMASRMRARCGFEQLVGYLCPPSCLLGRLATRLRQLRYCG